MSVSSSCLVLGLMFCLGLFCLAMCDCDVFDGMIIYNKTDQQYLDKNPWGYCGLGGTGLYKACEPPKQSSAM